MFLKACSVVFGGPPAAGAPWAWAQTAIPTTADRRSTAAKLIRPVFERSIISSSFVKLDCKVYHSQQEYPPSRAVLLRGFRLYNRHCGRQHCLVLDSLSLNHRIDEISRNFAHCLALA